MNAKVVLAVMVLLSSFMAAIAQADWTLRQRQEFTNGCISSCRNSPNICQAYCACVMREGEMRYSSAEYEILERDARDKVQSAILREFSALFPLCERRVLGR